MAGHARYTALLDACVLYPTVADAILDRLMQHCRRFSLEGESRRTGRAGRAQTKPGKTDPQAQP